jgi:hypothetical protein
MVVAPNANTGNIEKRPPMTALGSSSRPGAYIAGYRG